MSFQRLFYPMVVVAACASAMAQVPVGELVASDASVKGSVVLAAGGTKVASGSAVKAGDSSASLRLARGGEVRICPKTSLSVTASQSGRDLMLGMGTGAIETHYLLTNSADTVMTPDFRILLAGPGTFHFAINADARGNTCVKALPSNSSSIIISEVMGDGVYQVRANDQVLFRNGSVANPEMNPAGDCGCPPPPAPVNTQRAEFGRDGRPEQRAELKPPPEPPPVKPKPAPAKAARVPEAAKLFEKAPETKSKSVASVTAPPPPLNPNDIHIEVDAPFVFRASDPVVPPRVTVVSLRLASTQVLEPPTVLPPPVAPAAPPPAVAQAPKPKKKGFFGRIGSLFASVFH